MLFGLFSKKRTLSGRVIKAWEHEGWGNSIYWSDYSKFRVTGWLSNKPRVNDEIQFEMLTSDNQKVKTRYIVTDVEHAGDPRDMFWATLKPFAYVGQAITDKSVKEAV